MKKKTTNAIVIVIALLFSIAAVLLIAFSGGKVADNRYSETETLTSESISNELKIEDPETTETIKEGLEIDPITDDTIGELDPDEILTIPDETAPSVPSPVSAPGRQPAEKTAKPITDKAPDDDGSIGVSVGNSQIEPYDCGTPGHHCDGPETHAYILNLELEGCPYCHKNNCQSFYATDEWGNSRYTPSECPQYDIHKDPVCYCQTCGKKCGDGSHGTCVQFVNTCSCPNCGEWVESWTCHTCKG